MAIFSQDESSQDESQSVPNFPDFPASAGMCELVSTVLGSPNPQKLASFYANLLDFDMVIDQPDWVKIQSLSGGKALSFQYEESYIPPVWPDTVHEQHMMMHLDIGVSDMDYVITKAVNLGAQMANHQPQAEVRVMLDPDGHPFCLFPLVSG